MNPKPGTLERAILDLLRAHVDLTPRQVRAKLAGSTPTYKASAYLVGKALVELRAAKLAQAEWSGTGVEVWNSVATETAPAPAATPTPPEPPAAPVAPPQRSARPKNRPYTPTAIAGAYRHRGALVIKLHRRIQAKSLTLSEADLALILNLRGAQS